MIQTTGTYLFIAGLLKATPWRTGLLCLLPPIRKLHLPQEACGWGSCAGWGEDFSSVVIPVFCFGRDKLFFGGYQSVL